MQALEEDFISSGVMELFLELGTSRSSKHVMCRVIKKYFDIIIIRKKQSMSLGKLLKNERAVTFYRSYYAVKHLLISH